VNNQTKDFYYQIHVSRYKTLFCEIKSLGLPERSKVLDIGCFPPYLYNFLKKQNFDVYGICSPHEVLNQPKVSVLNIDTDSLPYRDDQFDLVVMSEVMEHLTDNPVNIMSEVYRVLKPNGFFLLTTPNVLRTQNVISLIIGKNIYFSLDQLKNSSQKTGTIYFRHNREYTLAEVLILLKSSCFSKTISKHFISYPPFRTKNHADSFWLKIQKYLNYCLMMIFTKRKDTLLILAQK
jgi:SAM-dependent methyltransferase